MAGPATIDEKPELQRNSLNCVVARCSMYFVFNFQKEERMAVTKFDFHFFDLCGSTKLVDPSSYRQKERKEKMEGGGGVGDKAEQRSSFKEWKKRATTKNKEE